MSSFVVYRLLGLTPFTSTSCEEPRHISIVDAEWATFVNPLVLMCLYFVLVYETKLLRNPVVSSVSPCLLTFLRALKLLCCSLTLSLSLIWWDFNLEGCVLFHSFNFPLGNMLTPRRWWWVHARTGPTGHCPWLAASRARWCTARAATQTTRGRRRDGALSGGRAPTQPLPLPISAEYFLTTFS